jgi:hypothetical protein
MKNRPKRWRLQPRHIVLAVAGLALAWLVISRTGAAYLATRRPELALLLQAGEPQAWLEVAQRRMDAVHEGQQAAQRAAARGGVAKEVSGEIRGAEKSHADPGGIGPAGPTDGGHLDGAETGKILDAATRALRTAPLDSRALRILAQLADVSGDKARKERLLAAIVLRTKHEPLAGYWLMLEALERKDFAGVVNFADSVLSKHPDLAPHVAPVLVRMLETHSGDQELRERLKANPVWRSNFFLALPAAITDARTPLELLLSLKGSPAPPTDYEIRVYLNFLMGRQLYEIAYYAWLQMLNPEVLKQVATVHNGSFDLPLTNMPFDWSIPPSEGALVEIATPSGESRKALHVEFGHGRVTFQAVQQYLLLAPGRYHFKVMQKGEVTGRRGLQWTVQCAENTKRLTETPMFVGVIADWSEAIAEFTVPEKNCRLQQILLQLPARHASEQIVKGSAWFDDVQIVRQIKD